jgi:hypothetical protein
MVVLRDVGMLEVEFEFELIGFASQQDAAATVTSLRAPLQASMLALNTGGWCSHLSQLVNIRTASVFSAEASQSPLPAWLSHGSHVCYVQYCPPSSSDAR